MNDPFPLNDGTQLFPPNVRLVDDGCLPRDAAQWSLKDSTGRSRPLSLAEACGLAGELRIELVLAQIAAIEKANDLSRLCLGQLAVDVDGQADEMVIALVKLGQFVEQATHDLSLAPVGAELV